MISDKKKSDEKSEVQGEKTEDLGYLWKFLIKLGVIAVLCAVLLIFVIGFHVNYGNNMYPAIRDGDLCVTVKIHTYTVGDVVAYKIDGQRRFGRIVATPGHEVDIDNQGLLIDGTLRYEEVVYPTTANGAKIELPYMVESGQYFLLNDYREDATDSRVYGAFDESEFDGAVVLVLRRRGI